MQIFSLNDATLRVAAILHQINNVPISAQQSTEAALKLEHRASLDSRSLLATSKALESVHRRVRKKANGAAGGLVGCTGGGLGALGGRLANHSADLRGPAVGQQILRR